MAKTFGAAAWRAGIGLLVAGAIAVAAVILARSDPRGEKGSGLGSRFALDLTGLREIDPGRIGYEQAAAFPTGFKESRGIAAGADGRIYVSGDRGVRVFDRAGERLSEIAATGEPGALAVAGDGTLYAAMGDHVEAFDAEGKKTSAWRAPSEKTWITSIALAPGRRTGTAPGGAGAGASAGAAEVFVADYGRREVLRCDGAGRLLNRIVPAGADGAPATFNVPSPYFDVAVGPDGLVRVAHTGERRIEAYTPAGEFRSAWGRSSADVEGFIGCCNPAHIAIFPDGEILTSEKQLPTVKIYSPDGRLETVVADPRTLTPDPAQCTNFFRKEGLDVAIGPDGRVLVLDPLGIVRVFVRRKEG